VALVAAPAGRQGDQVNLFERIYGGQEPTRVFKAATVVIAVASVNLLLSWVFPRSWVFTLIWAIGFVTVIALAVFDVTRKVTTDRKFRAIVNGIGDDHA
jgi:hypothetical protein